MRSPNALRGGLLLVTWLAGALAAHAQARLDRIVTNDDLRTYVLANHWWWENVKAPADRECVFMPDGTFRHPRFVARWTILNLREVKLTRRNGRTTESAKMTFLPGYQRFEAIDFNKQGRISGRRYDVPKS